MHVGLNGEEDYRRVLNHRKTIIISPFCICMCIHNETKCEIVKQVIYLQGNVLLCLQPF